MHDATNRLRTLSRRSRQQHLASLVLTGALLSALILSPTVSLAQAQSTEADQQERQQQLFLPFAHNHTLTAAQSSEVDQPVETPDPLEDSGEGYDALIDSTSSESVTSAATNTALVVTKTSDSDDGICDSDCSLREAAAVTAATPDTPEEIILAKGTYRLQLGSLPLVNVTVRGVSAKNTVIDGSGNGVDADGAGIPVIRFDPAVGDNGAGGKLERLTVRGGSGAGIVHAAGALILDNVIVRNNGELGVYSGGEDAGDVAIYNCRIENNGDDGIVFNQQIGLVQNCLVYQNKGDGITVQESAITILDSTISSNNGTGLYATFSGKATIERSAVIYNKDGGVVVADAKATIVNSTISNNSTKGDGGGLEIKDVAEVSLNFVTIARNTADSDNNHSGDGGGLFVQTLLDGNNQPFNRLDVANSIIADNVDKSRQSPDCAGVITSAGYNLVENVSGCTITGVTTGNLTGLDPKLGSLNLNGAQTKNHLPAKNSSVIDAIVPAACPAGSQDQRGVLRPQDGNGDGSSRCDIGAVERKGP